MCGRKRPERKARPFITGTETGSAAPRVSFSDIELAVPSTYPSDEDESSKDEGPPPESLSKSRASSFTEASVRSLHDEPSGLYTRSSHGSVAGGKSARSRNKSPALSSIFNRIGSGSPARVPSVTRSPSKLSRPIQKLRFARKGAEQPEERESIQQRFRSHLGMQMACQKHVQAFMGLSGANKQGAGERTHSYSKLVQHYGDTVICVAFSSDERLFAVAGQLGHVVLYDVATGNELHVHKLPKKVGITSLLLSGPSSNLMVMFGTFKGEFQTFEWSCNGTRRTRASARNGEGVPPPIARRSSRSPSARRSRSLPVTPDRPSYSRTQSRTQAAWADGSPHADEEGEPVSSVPMLCLEEERLTTPFPWAPLLPDSPLESMAMSEKYRLVVLGGATETLQFYYLFSAHAPNGQLAFGRSTRSVRHDGKVSSISIGASGELLVVGGDSTTLNVFEVASGLRLRRLLISSPCISVALSQDGTKLAVGSAMSTKLFQMRWEGPGTTVRPSTEKLLEFPQGTPQGQVAFSADGLNLAMAGEMGIERAVTVISTSTGATMRQQRFDERVRCVALDSNGSRLLLGTFGKVAELYFQGSGTTMKHFGPSPDTVRCVYMHEGDGLLAVSGDTPGGGTVYVYNAKQASQNVSTPLFKISRAQKVWSVTISPDAKWITAGGYDSCIAVYDLELLRHVAAAGGDVSAVQPVQELDYKVADFRGPCFVWSSAFSGNGKVFVSGSWNGYAYMYDVCSGMQPEGPLKERIKIRFTRGERVYSVATSNEGDRMVIGGRDGDVVMYKCQDDETPRRLWVAGGRDFVYAVSMTHQFCAFAGTSRLVQVVSATTGDLLYRFSVFGNVQSLCIHKSFVAVGVQEESTVAVHDISKLQEILCLPSVHGAVHHVHLDDDALIFAGGKQASMYGGGGDFSWSQAPDYYVAAALIHGELQMALRCLSSILSRNPEIVNCRHPRRGGTFLQYVTQVNPDMKILRLLLEGNDQTKIGLLYDTKGETALHTALRLGSGHAVGLLISAIINGRIMNLPSALEAVVECFPRLACEHPREFIRLLRDQPLIVQREAVWPRYERAVDRILTMGSDEARLREPWRIESGTLTRTAIFVREWCVCLSKLCNRLQGKKEAVEPRSLGSSSSMRKSSRGGEHTLAEDAENGFLRQADGDQNTMFALLTNGATVEAQTPAQAKPVGSWNRFKMMKSRRTTKDNIVVNIDPLGGPPSVLELTREPRRRSASVPALFGGTRTPQREAGLSPSTAPTSNSPPSQCNDRSTSPHLEEPVEGVASRVRMAQLLASDRLNASTSAVEYSNSATSRGAPIDPTGDSNRGSVDQRSTGGGLWRARTLRPTQAGLAEKSTKSLAEATLRPRPTGRPAAAARARAIVGQTKVFTVPWRGWAARGVVEDDKQSGTPYLQLIIAAVNLTDDLTVFQADAVRALLEFKWRAFARTVFTTLLLFYLVGLIATIVQAERLIRVLVMRHGWASGTAEPDSLEPIWYKDRFDPAYESCYADWDTAADVWRGLTNCQSSIVWTYVLTFLRAIFFLVLEFVEMHNEGLRSYFHEYWNYLDLTNSLLPLVIDLMILFPTTWESEAKGHALANVMAVTCLVAGVKLFWHVRVIGNVGPLVAMVVEIMLTNVIPFLLLMVIAVFAFSFALYILLGPTDIFFATPVSAFSMSWGMAVYVRGDHTHMNFVRKRFINPQLQYGAEGGESDITLALLIYEALMLMVQVVLLNLLIAIMSDTYTRARESILLKARYDKAQIVWEYELLTCWVLRNYDRCRERLWRLWRWLTRACRRSDGWEEEEEPFLEASGQRLFPDWLHLVCPGGRTDRQATEFNADAGANGDSGSAHGGGKSGKSEQDPVSAAQLMNLEASQMLNHRATSNMLLNLKSALLQVCDNLGIEQARLGEHMTPTITPPLLVMQNELHRLSLSLQDIQRRLPPAPVEAAPEQAGSEQAGPSTPSRNSTVDLDEALTT